MRAFVIPTCRVTHRSVVDWWVSALGAQIVAMHPDDAEDSIEHAEVRLGESRVMASTPRDNAVDRPPGTMSLYWVVDEPAAIDALHERATAAGGASVAAPYDADYGGRHCTVADPDGNLWSFGTYRGDSETA